MSTDKDHRPTIWELKQKERELEDLAVKQDAELARTQSQLRAVREAIDKTRKQQEDKQ